MVETENRSGRLSAGDLLLTAIFGALSAASGCWFIEMLDFPLAGSGWDLAAEVLAVKSVVSLSVFFPCGMFVWLSRERLDPETSLCAFWLWTLACSAGLVGWQAGCSLESAGSLGSGRAWMIALGGALALSALGAAAHVLSRRMRAMNGGGFFWSAAPPTSLFLFVLYVAVSLRIPKLQEFDTALRSLIALAVGLLFWNAVLHRRRVSPVLKRLVGRACLGIMLVSAVSASWRAAAQWRAAAALPEGRPRWIVLLTVDTLRADALEFLNPSAHPTPHLNALARDSVVFTRAFSNAPWTVPGFGSIMTGVHPVVHGALDTNTRLAGGFETLAERLAAAGYRTMTFQANPFLSPDFGFDQGFDEYGWVKPVSDKADLHPLLRRLLDWPGSYAGLDQTGRLTRDATMALRLHGREPVFLWLHYFDPHLPYQPTAEYLDRITTAPQRLIYHEWTPEPRALDEREKREVANLYMAELAYVDDQAGMVLEAIRRHGLYDDTLVVFTSDHGEELWDHGGFEHGHTLHRELLHIPLTVKLPGNEPRGTREMRVENSRIFATVLDQAGLTPSGGTPVSESLVPLIRGEAPGEDPPIVATGVMTRFPPADSILLEGRKLIRPRAAGSHPTLYDLDTDPNEMKDIAAREPELARKLTAALDEFLTKSDQERKKLAITPEELSVTPGGVERSELEALGYLR